jgi:hypothetical protein
MTLFRVWLAHVQALSGDTSAAYRTVHGALAEAQSGEQQGNEAWAQAMSGQIATLSTVLDRSASACFHRALDKATTLGMRPLVAHCHLGLGKSSRRTSQIAQAKEHLTTATTMYREMGMRFYMEQAEAKLRGLA